MLHYPTLRVDDLIVEYRNMENLFGIIENFVLDIYESSSLSCGGVVIDIGAGIGDYSLLASKKVGKKGRVIAIEPNPFDYEILLKNITANSATNVFPINVGISNSHGYDSIEFAGERFTFATMLLREVLRKFDVRLYQLPSYCKIDVEGYETRIIQESADVMCGFDEIAIELHGTKTSIDDLLLPLGFRFRSIKHFNLRHKMLKHAVFHPLLSYDLYTQVKFNLKRPLINYLLGDFDIVRKSGLMVGKYVKDNSSR